MAFLIPGFLAGLVFAAMPVIIHLVYRRKAPQIVFAAARFVKSAARRTARRRRIDNLVLLVLRTLLLGLLAFGLAGPLVKRAIGGGASGTDVVIIVDNSLSMSAVENSVPRFTRAKEAVDSALERLSKGDLVAVIPTAPLPGEPTARAAFSSDLAAVRTRAARLAASSAAGSAAAALERAAALFKGSAAADKLLYVVTDLQAAAFPARNSLSDEARAALLTVPVMVYDCAASTPRNVSVDSVAVAAQGGVAGTPVEVRAKISSNSPAAETIVVSLHAAGEKVDSRTVSLVPSGSAEVALSTIAKAPGVLDGFVAVETDDAIGADNRRYFTLTVRERIRALVVERERTEPAFDDDAFFLSRALDPFLGEASGGRSPFDVTVKAYADAKDFASYDVVYLVLRGGLDAALSNALSGYVARGGNLVVFASDDPSLSGAQLPWLPARLVGLKTADKAAGKSFTVGSLDANAPALLAFKDEPPALYNTVRVYDYWMSEPSAKDARVLARYDTSDPAMVLARSGAGSVALFTLAPLRAMTTIAASEFFLPLVHETTYYLLASSSGPGEVFAGNPVVLAPPSASPGRLVVTSPDGQSRVAAAEAGRPLVWTDTSRLGVYRARDDGAAADRFAFSAGVDPAESDLARLDPAAVKTRIAASRLFVVSSARTLEEALLSLKPILALGDMVLYAVLALALLECLAANRIPARPVRD